MHLGNFESTQEARAAQGVTITLLSYSPINFPRTSIIRSLIRSLSMNRFLFKKNYFYEKTGNIRRSKLPLPSLFSLSRTRSFLGPLFPSCCYTGYTLAAKKIKGGSGVNWQQTNGQNFDWQLTDGRKFNWLLTFALVFTLNWQRTWLSLIFFKTRF